MSTTTTKVITAILKPPNLAMMRRWFPPIVETVDKFGTIWVFVSNEEAAEVKIYATQYLKLYLRSWVVWMHGRSCYELPLFYDGFVNTHTHLFFLTRHKSIHTFYPERIRIPSARQLVYRDKRANPSGRLPDDTWILLRQDERDFPSLLLERIVLCSTDQNDTILEPWPIGVKPIATRLNRFTTSNVGEKP